MALSSMGYPIRIVSAHEKRKGGTAARRRESMKKRVLSILCTLALCLTLLPATAEAAEWEHSVDDHSDWTALTSDTLTSDEQDESNYTLTSGKYYLSGDDTEWGPFLVLYYTITIPAGEEVTLCLHDANCSSAVGVAIKVEAGATLTICDCSPEGDAYLQGLADASTGDEFAAIENHGTLNLVSGNIGGGYLAVDNRESNAEPGRIS